MTLLPSLAAALARRRCPPPAGRRPRPALAARGVARPSRSLWRAGWLQFERGSNGIYSIPLPGGASLGSHPYQVTAQFANVVDLVPQSAVKVNDVASAG